MPYSNCLRLALMNHNYLFVQYIGQSMCDDAVFEPFKNTKVHHMFPQVIPISQG